MGYSISQSLISSQPPLIVFTACLTAFGFTMVVLAYVVGEKEMPNPDVKMDWNKFFTKVANLKLCPVQNYSENTNGDLPKNILGSILALNSSTLHVVDESKSMSAVLSGVVDLAMDGQLHESMFVDVSVAVKFGVLGKFPHESNFNLKGQIKGNLLGFSGKYGRLLYNVTLSFKPLINNNCTTSKCYFMYDVCITMSWPVDFLPKTKSPERCKIQESKAILPIIFYELPISDLQSSKTCMELSYTHDAKLTEMLSLHERSIVNLHLMHTSYFMFVMVMTLVCYSLVMSRIRHPKNYAPLQKAMET